MNEIAISSLDKDVIFPLKHIVDRSDIGSTTKFKLKNLLGQALMTCGEWMSDRKSASSVDILEHYFKAAVEYAQNPQTHIKTSLACANFNFILYQEAVQRTQSAEWLENKKLNQARTQEVGD